MPRIKPAQGFNAAMIAFVSILSFAGASASGDGNEDLQMRANRTFGPLPKMMASASNPITPEKVKLGKILFHETRISVDGTVSCARCHLLGSYATDGLRKAVGNQCRINPRNAPTVLNAAMQISAHWIGNRTDVEDQAKQSVVGPPSFGMPSYAEVESRLKEIGGYGPLFKEAFPDDMNPITVDNLAKAVGAFERTLVTPSPFDDFMTGNPQALSEPEKKGLVAFMEKGCSGCHSGVYVGGGEYEKFGLLEPYWAYTKSREIDEGRFVVTKDESDKYVFKVPILRNVAKTNPYFHDGSVDDLLRAEYIMGKIQLGRELSNEELGDIGAFLKSLTGTIPDDALIIPMQPSTD